MTFGLLSPDQLKFVVVIWFVILSGSMLWFGLRRPAFAVPIVAGLALIAANPIFAYLGSEVRPYSFLIAVAVALLLTSFEWVAVGLRGQSPRRLWRLLMVTFMAAAAWTHYAGVLLAVATFLSVETIALIRRRRFDLPLVTSALLAAFLFSPALFLFAEQRSIDVPTANTPADEVLRYFGWGVGGLGVIIAVLALAGFLVGAWRSRSNRGETDQSVDDARVLLDAGWTGLLIAAFFVLLASLVNAIAGVQFINIGVSIVPVSVAVIGAACIATIWLSRVVLVVTFASLMLMVPTAMSVTDTPHILRGNRISNVDILLETSQIVGFDHRAGEGTLIIMLDGSASNLYFAEHTEKVLPAASLALVQPAQGEETFPGLLEQALVDPAIDQTVVITRYSFEARVAPHVPEGAKVIRVHLYAWLIEPDSDS